MTTIRIKTPHAAVKIWNYVDRINIDGVEANTENKIEKELIISTVSCTGIQTYKSKSDPVGSFSFSLAPTRNWVSTITPGSWCVIMMSNEPIDQKSFVTADKDLVKMLGKIDSVRVEVSSNPDGSRETRYLVSGQDWGQIFSDTLYIDPLISDQKEDSDQGNSLFIMIQHMLTTANGSPIIAGTRQNLLRLLSVFGKPLKGLDGVDRLAKATHTLQFPEQVTKFFKFDSTEVTKVLELKSGKLNEAGSYIPVEEGLDGLGWINPFSLIGTHTLWQVMQDNANYALNEMYTEMNWNKDEAQLLLYNRIKPFSFQKTGVAGAETKLRSKFQNIPTHKLDDSLVINVNAGTNWKDKFNFIEVKPEIQEFKVFDVWLKQRAQAYNKGKNGGTKVFDREGFRPLIFSVKQVPLKKDKSDPPVVKDLESGNLKPWVNLIQEWYFDSHRLLNGELVMTGSTDYIAVGNNIMFDAGLLNLTPNYNSATTTAQKYYVLAQIESIKHNFAINGDARTFQTTIQFVRGIIVDSQKKLIGDGAIDSLSTSYSKKLSKNDANIVVTSTTDTPSKE